MTNSADWFAKKMAQGSPIQQGRPDPTPAMPPSQQPMTLLPQFQQDAPRLPGSAVTTDSCPECGSGNYMTPGQQIGKRCYDCGYPISQSGSKYGSLSVANVTGGVTQAQGNNATNNYNPQGIIGRIQ